MRENGGQYTHAAIWTAMAFAKLGDADRAWELFIGKQGDPLHFRPHMPKTWDSYKLHYRYLQTVYHLTFIRDPEAPPPEALHLQNDRQEHHVEIRVRENRKH